jgi:hypothetical protein
MNAALQWLYIAYKNWCREHGLKPTPQVFSMSLLGLSPKRGYPVLGGEVKACITERVQPLSDPIRAQTLAPTKHDVFHDAFTTPSIGFLKEVCRGDGGEEGGGRRREGERERRSGGEGRSASLFVLLLSLAHTHVCDAYRQSL